MSPRNALCLKLISTQWVLKMHFLVSTIGNNFDVLKIFFLQLWFFSKITYSWIRCSSFD